MKKCSYWATLSESFAALFKHPKIFIPVAIMFLINLAFFPLYSSFVNFNFSLTNILLLMIFYPLLILIGLVFYGWTFAIIRQIVSLKKVTFKTSFKEGFKLAWKIFVISLLLLVGLIVFYFVVIV